MRDTGSTTHAKDQPRLLFMGMSASDAGKIVRLLRRLGIAFSVRQAITQARARQQLAEFRPSHVLADDTSPEFRGDVASHLLLGSGSQAAFILFTDALSEETAAEILARGDEAELLRACLKHPTGMFKALQSSVDDSGILDREMNGEQSLTPDGTR